MYSATKAAQIAFIESLRAEFRHPNYVAVVVEGFALPLVHTAWVTALVFTVLNIPLLAVRLRDEERALRTATSPAP